MTDAALTDLDPRLQLLARQFLDECAAAGLTTRIIVTWRSSVDQNACKAHGLSNAEPGQSPHNSMSNGHPAARAFDFAVFADGVYVTNGKDQRYSTAGQIAKKLGLVWGGDFHSFPDYDHIELAAWRENATSTAVGL